MHKHGTQGKDAYPFDSVGLPPHRCSRLRAHLRLQACEGAGKGPSGLLRGACELSGRPSPGPERRAPHTGRQAAFSGGRLKPWPQAFVMSPSSASLTSLSGPRPRDRRCLRLTDLLLRLPQASPVLLSGFRSAPKDRAETQLPYGQLIERHLERLCKHECLEAMQG